MTTSPYEQVPETLRLADEWLRETQREVDRRNSAYDHYGMGSTPETLDPLGAKMAAELRRQHAENEALRAGYNAARLEIESLKPQIIPGVQWQCGPLASGFTAPQPGTTPKADSQPAPVPTRAFLERTLAAMEGVIDVADRQTDEFEALRSCVIDLTVLLFSKSAPARDYPPLPMQFACSGVFPVYSADQMRAYVDADRAARAPADSVTAPAAYSGNIEQELAMLIRRIVSSARRNCEDGSNVLKLANEAWVYLVRKGLNGSPLRDAGIESDPTPAAQAADSQPAPVDGANWQDISTAPKDGTRFVAVGNNYGLYSEGQHTCIAQWFRGCWMDVSEWNETSELKYLTHWMPLLPLPGSAARAPADSVTAPAGERENLALRRMLCVAHAGAAAYMDDGEAQDSCELPIIDFLRDTPDEIQDKLQKRMLNKLTDGTVDAARHFFDAGWKACAKFCDRDDVRFDGIVGHRGCPQFEEAFRAARKQGGT